MGDAFGAPPFIARIFSLLHAVPPACADTSGSRPADGGIRGSHGDATGGRSGRKVLWTSTGSRQDPALLHRRGTGALELCAAGRRSSLRKKLPLAPAAQSSGVENPLCAVCRSGIQRT